MIQMIKAFCTRCHMYFKYLLYCIWHLRHFSTQQNFQVSCALKRMLPFQFKISQINHHWWLAEIDFGSWTVKLLSTWVGFKSYCQSGQVDHSNVNIPHASYFSDVHVSGLPQPITISRPPATDLLIAVQRHNTCVSQSFLLPSPPQPPDVNWIEESECFLSNWLF